MFFTKKILSVEEFRKLMSDVETVTSDSRLFETFHFFSQNALKITHKLNSTYHKPEIVRKLFAKLTKSKIDKSFNLFPPFYTDCGVNIKIGKRVFINCCCRFQDQGGIEIGDDCLIGHNTTIATLNHDFNPQRRADLIPKKVRIENKVWIGSDCTILPGVTIGEGAIIGAGSVVTKNIPPNTIAVGNPAKVIRKIEDTNL